MTPEKPPTAEFGAVDYLNLLWRRRKLFLVPFAVVTAAALGVGSVLPKGFESKTITKVIERSYLDRIYAGMNVAPPPSVELGIAEFEIKNRERLARILENEKMLAEYATEAERQAFIEKVQGRIEVQIITPKVSGGDKLLTIVYTGRTPFEAQTLVNRITQDYISRLKKTYRESIRVTRAKAHEEAERSEVAYLEAKDRLQEFEEQHLEALMGGEQPTYERRVEQLQDKLENAVNEVYRLDHQIKSYRMSVDDLEPEIVKRVREVNPLWASLSAQAQAVKGQLDTLLSNRQPDHPLVLQKQGEYAGLMARLAEIKQYLRDEEIREPNPKYEDTNLALSQALADLDHLQEQRMKLMENLDLARERANRLPMVRSEHKNLTGALERAQDEFKAFNKKLLQAETTWLRVTSTLDDLFVTIESASQPLRHSTPPAALILLIAVALGLAAGMGTVLAVEMGRKTFHSPEDVVAALRWPVIGVVHTILSQREQRQRVRKRAAAVVATLILLIGVSTVVYIYNRNPDLLPDFLVDSVQKFRDLI